MPSTCRSICILVAIYRYLCEITDCRQLQLLLPLLLHSAYKLMHFLCAISVSNRNERCKCSDPVEILVAHCRLSDYSAHWHTRRILNEHLNDLAQGCENEYIDSS